MKKKYLRKLIADLLVESFKVRGYIKPANSFHSLPDLYMMANYILNLQKAGYDARDKNSGLLLSVLYEYMPHIEDDVKRYASRFDVASVYNFLEDFANHRIWSFEDQFSQYFPDIASLKFSYFYSRGDMEPYVLLDENYTKQIYGSVRNIKTVKHYTTSTGLKNIQESIKTGNSFDISCFTSIQKDYFDQDSNIIITLEGNIRAGFRSDVKSFAVDNGRRACNLFRLGYPGKETNICEDLSTCDEGNSTSIWNEYIATPVKILKVEEVKK
jgi:hypothetical protein